MGLRFFKKYGLFLALFLVCAFVLYFVYFQSLKENGPSVQEKSKLVVLTLGNSQNPRNLQQKIDTLKKLTTDSNEYRMNYVKEMMRFAFNNYKFYAWGENELRPISKIGHSASVFGSAKIGSTIIDAVDTLHIMGLKDEYDAARKWIATFFDLKMAQEYLSVFEINIRYVGGLLSTFALTKDKMFLDKAKEVADLLLPAFNTSTGIPLALINVRTGKAFNYGWAYGGCSILSELGSLELEFDYLSRATNDPKYIEKARKIRNVLGTLKKPNGLYPLYVNPHTGRFCSRQYSVGALGDSFYEYLLKLWLLNGKTDSKIKRVYDAAMTSIEKNMLRISKPSNFWYFVEIKGTRVEHKMDHLACFMAGMFALQSVHETDPERKAHALKLGKEIGNTCHESYVRSATGIGPESMRFVGSLEATTNRNSEMYYLLRPEVIEGWFVLYRVTGDAKYREWCWAATQAIQRYCHSTAGYSGLKNVYDDEPKQDDVQQSFFFAETLKYLYLTFSESSVIPLDEWVFNTEAHPFPIVKISTPIV